MNISKYILPLIIISLLFVTGCAKSQETIDFENNLFQADENLGVSLKNVYTDFYNYNIDYSADRIFSSVAITQSMVKGMENKENEIKEDMASFEEDMNTYNSMRTSADIDSISEENKRIDQKIQTKISDFNSAKPKIESCLSYMVTFREFVDLGRLNTIKLEDFTYKNELINNQIESEDYADALTEVENLKRIVRELKTNAEDRSKLGILTFSDQVINSWELYIDSLDELKVYIEYLDDEDYDSAETQYVVYSKAYTATIDESQDENLMQSLDEIDAWYYDNIGVCLTELKKYS